MRIRRREEEKNVNDGAREERAHMPCGREGGLQEQRKENELAVWGCILSGGK